VGNAFKFTRQGSVDVRAEAVSGPSNQEWSLRFSVTDTGLGIAPNKLRQIFDAFYQVDDSSTREFRGAGLGLTISRELAKMLGGEVQVESQLGKGSTFSFTCVANRSVD